MHESKREIINGKTETGKKKDRNERNKKKERNKKG
jgi:hypothetical protein